MKRWSTRSPRRPERRPPGRGRRLRRRLGLAIAAAGLLASGCVTRGTHQQVVSSLEGEIETLEVKVRDLERSNEALDKERVALIDEMEDLRQQRESLSSDVEKLSRTKELLSQHLRQREEQVKELSKLKTTYRGLVDELESEVSAGQIQIEQLREGIRMNLAQDILFRSGSASLEGSGVAVLRKVGGKLRDMTHTVEVQGHTDDVPLSPALARRYGTNWELAAARAASVVRLLEDGGVNPDRLKVVSFGEHKPVASNDTPEGRAYNRRIEIRLRPVEAPEVPVPASQEGGEASAVGSGGEASASAP